MRFFKYHGLGNDYLVLDPKDGNLPSPRDVRVICHRNFGLGSDGILVGPLPSTNADFRLRIINPDASEAEKSGNGLRIFAKYLIHESYANEGTAFTVETLGGIVTCLVEGESITVDMGKVSFDATRIPVSGFTGEVIEQPLEIAGRTYSICAATIGNPHCVLHLPEISPSLAHELGPQLETHPAFPNRTNVQFLKILDRQNIQIEIWERGAGYTLASGSSSSAAGAVARRLGLVDGQITVHMPGGEIGLHISEDFAIRMTGPATRVGVFHLDPECLAAPFPEA